MKHNGCCKKHLRLPVRQLPPASADRLRGQGDSIRALPRLADVADREHHVVSCLRSRYSTANVVHIIMYSNTASGIGCLHALKQGVNALVLATGTNRTDLEQRRPLAQQECYGKSRDEANST